MRLVGLPFGKRPEKLVFKCLTTGLVCVSLGISGSGVGCNLDLCEFFFGYLLCSAYEMHTANETSYCCGQDLLKKTCLPASRAFDAG